MRRLPKGLLPHVVALSVPTVAVVALSALFYAFVLPDMIRDEPERVRNASMEAAQNLLENPETADIVWRKGEGVVKGSPPECRDSLPWSDSDDISAWQRLTVGRKKQRRMWGWSETPGGRLVWVRDSEPGRDANVVYAAVTDIAPRDYRTIFYVFGLSFLFVLVGMTFLGVRYFVDYAIARDDFMRATAHDLTTPLVGLRYLIGRDDGGARALNERLIRLVDNVRDFMHLGGRRRDPARAPFDLRRAYDEAYALFADDYRDALGGADVAVDEPPGGVPRALGDETMAVQILWNLLGNDLKYAAPFGSVKVVFRRDGDSVAVDFVDEGPGMTRRERERAFDRYYRAKTVLESGKGGFGIGLCTAREFAVAMGGSLTVRANSPRGCVFTLELPAEKTPS